jgi:Tfp pilus assembly protein PilO
VTEGVKQYATVLGGGAVVIGLVSVLAVLPARSKLGAAQAGLDAVEGQIVESQQRLRPLGRLTERVAQVEGELRTGRKALLRQSELGTFLERVARIAADQRLTGLEPTPGQMVAEGELFRMPMKLTFSGQLAGVFAFLRETEALPYFTRVDELKLGNDARYTGKLTATLDISVFFSADDPKKP